MCIRDRNGSMPKLLFHSSGFHPLSVQNDILFIFIIANTILQLRLIDRNRRGPRHTILTVTQFKPNVMIAWLNLIMCLSAPVLSGHAIGCVDLSLIHI